jgi:hypothetical protein
MLIDMLAEHTTMYIRLLKEEGFSTRSNGCKEAMENIQFAIEGKKNLLRLY